MKQTFICRECHNLQTHRDGDEIICNGCGRTFNSKTGKELKDKTRAINIGANYRMTHIPGGRVSAYDKSTGDLLVFNESEAKALKKFLNETV